MVLGLACVGFGFYGEKGGCGLRSGNQAVFSFGGRHGGQREKERGGAVKTASYRGERVKNSWWAEEKRW